MLIKKFSFLLALLIATTSLAAGPDQVLPGDKVKIGKAGATDKIVEAMKSGTTATNPKLKWNNGSSVWQFSTDGSTYKTFNLGTDINSAAASSGTVLTADGSGGSSFAAVANSVAATLQKFTSTGTTAGYLFTISTSSTVAIGDTYTNNGHTYTVLNTLTAQSGQILFTSGALAPLGSGTLTRATGAGTSSITFSAADALATYTVPSSPRAPAFLKVRMVGGGGGGQGSGTSVANGGTGGTTVFGSNILIATGGSSGAPGTGGTATVNSPAYGLGLSGSDAGSGNINSSNGTPVYGGGSGASTPFGGAGSGAVQQGSGGAAKANTGSGGGGGGTNTTSSLSGFGGAAGAYVDAIIPNPVASALYYYAIGAGGSAGTAQLNGGAGGSGVLLVEEYY
jgi:hypothetical protein